jgi:ABC-type antimicrobial peptide transport system permease subunit
MLPLELFRYGTRMKVLTFAIGICVAFIVGSFAFANGLNATVQEITGKFEKEGALVYAGDNLTSSLIDESAIAIGSPHISVGIAEALLNGTSYVFFAVKDPANLLGQDLVPSPGEMLAGKDVPVRGYLTITSVEGSVTLFANHTYSSTMFPTYWHLVRWEDIVKLRQALSNRTSFMIFTSMTDSLESSIKAKGLSLQPMPGIFGYFNAGANQVTNDLWLIIIPSSFIVAMLVYSAIAMETKDRAKEIAILKTIGANNGQIARIFMFQAFMLSLLGAIIGIVIGIIISYAISTSSSVVIENSLFYLKVTEYSMLVALVCTILAGMLGAIWPIYRASHQKVREAMT